MLTAEAAPVGEVERVAAIPALSDVVGEHAVGRCGLGAALPAIHPLAAIARAPLHLFGPCPVSGRLKLCVCGLGERLAGAGVEGAEARRYRSKRHRAFSKEVGMKKLRHSDMAALIGPVAQMLPDETMDDYYERMTVHFRAERGWPGNITMMSGQLHLLGVDLDTGQIYWDGEPIVTKHELGRREFLLAFVATWSTAAAALFAFGVFTIELGRAAGWWGG